jgi:hypothetical protein
MTTCGRCSSADVHWFTPGSASGEGAVFLCRRCGQLTIVPGRQAWRSPRASAEGFADRAKAA